MAIVELIMPKMGESIIEATIINWLKQEGDSVSEDETILEIATDKVDSDVPSPVNGIITKILHGPDDVVAVGKPLALIETDQAATTVTPPEPIAQEETISIPESTPVSEPEPAAPSPQPAAATMSYTPPAVSATQATELSVQRSDRFYSPLVRNIAKTENISFEELEQITGTGPHARVTKEDLFRYTEERRKAGQQNMAHPKAAAQSVPVAPASPTPAPVATASVTDIPTTTERVAGPNEEIVELDRMRKVIAKHMVNSLQTSPHVTSVVEADVTNIVQWRNRNKAEFQKKYGEKITFSPLFTQAVVKAIKDYPTINASLEDDKLIVKKNINIGIATALSNGNLIVPVIPNCDELSLVGMARRLNDITARARDNKLKPDEIRGGTFTISNIGTFGNIIGTPIINQPELAILAIGTIKKKPVIIETDTEDIIAIRHMMYLSLSYDHRIIDGYLGGSFLKRIADYIETFDPNTKV